MTQVHTARGPVEVEDLGPTLMHEHVFVLTTEVQLNFGEGPGGWWDEETRVEDAVEKLTRLRSKGIRTIVDPTVIGLGRYVPRIQRVADAVDLHIVLATGVYTYGDLPFAYSQQGPGTLIGGDEPMVRDFVRDLTDGIAGTGVRAAFLKCAVEHDPMSPGVERVLRAVARASIETGAPMTIHTSAPERTGRAVVRVLREEGADLTKLVVGHAGDSADLDYLTELADTGAILGMDRFGIDVFAPTGQRVDTIVALAERGYSDRMVLSHDASCFIDWFHPDPNALRDVVLPNWHYEYISDDILPMLRQRGVTDAQIDQMLVDNPRRYFGG